MRLLPCFVAMILIAVAAPTVFGFEMKSTRGNMLGGSISLSNPSATDFLSAPGLIGKDGALYLDAGVARRFELSELDVGYIAAGYRHGNLLLAVGAQQLGSSDLFAEQVGEIALGYVIQSLSVVQSLSASVTVSTKRLEFGGGYQSLNASAVGFGVGIQTRNGAIRFSTDNLNRPSFTEFSLAEPRMASVYAEFAGRRSFTISVRARFVENTRPDFGLGQTIILTEFAKLSWGISSEPLIYGAGFEISKSGVTFTYAGSIHPALGFSQNLTLSLLLAKKQN